MNDQQLTALMDQAIALDESAHPSRGVVDLDVFFWKPIAAKAGISDDVLRAHYERIREQKAEKKRDKEIRSGLDAVRSAVNAAFGAPDPAALNAAVKDVEAASLRVGRTRSNRVAVGSVADETANLEAKLEKYRGASNIGLPQGRLKPFDRATRGLRGLVLVAAGPNVGKTVLADQFMTDVLRENPDACAVFVSLELSRGDLMIRQISRAACLDWADVVFGSDAGRGRGRDAYFSEEEAARLAAGKAQIAAWADRAVVLDDENFPDPSIDEVIAVVEDLKKSTGATRAIVVVDYLQLWPIPDSAQRFLRSELAEDKWRIGEMKRLRDHLAGDPLLVISEARKPSGGSGSTWGGDLSDLMGTARIGYRADAVLLLRPFSDEQLQGEEALLKKYGAATGEKLREELSRDGIALAALSIAKGRDGVLRETFEVEHHYRQSRIEERRAEEAQWDF